MVKRSSFLSIYETMLRERFDWAKSPEKLAAFMGNVVGAITTRATTWDHTGETARAAWRVSGGKGRPTLKALRAMT